MNNATQHEQLLKFAASDLRTARKQGDVLVGGTIIGRISVAYDAETKTYHIVNDVLETVASGKAKVIKEALAKLYRVA
jgi:hypothetical protein|tara:strand:+ start:6017 stop:6250 length:234 start_codon:yes stop_codon:yes gene_type:complete